MTPLRPFPILLAAIFVVVAAGCAQVPVAEVPLARYDLPTPLATTQINLPIDAVRVAAAIVDRLDGGTGAAAGVTFTPDAVQAVDGSNIGLAGFDWRNTVLHQYTAQIDTPQDRVAAGELRFDDSQGRRAAIFFTVEYTTIEPIEVRQIALLPAFALDPAPVLYVAPAEAFGQIDAADLVSQGALLAAVAKAAVPWRTAPPPGDRDYLIFVFLMDQVSDSAEFSIGVSSIARWPGLWRRRPLPGRRRMARGGSTGAFFIWRRRALCDRRVPSRKRGRGPSRAAQNDRQLPARCRGRLGCRRKSVTKIHRRALMLLARIGYRSLRKFCDVWRPKICER